MYDVAVTHYDGRATRLDAGGQGINLRVGDEPLMLTFRGPADMLPPMLRPSPVSVVGLPESLTQGTAATVRVEAHLTGRPEDAAKFAVLGAPGTTVRTGTSLENVAMPAPDELPVLLKLNAQVTVPESGSPRRATLVVTDQTPTAPGQTELVVGIPVKGAVSVDLRPAAGDGKGGAGVSVILSNNSDREQPVRWNTEMVNEAPMHAGTFDLNAASAATAYFTGEAQGEAKLAPHESRPVRIGLAKVDPLTIYRVRATCLDAAGHPAQRERFMGGFASAGRVKGAITLDGNLDEPEWRAAPKYLINEERQYFYIHRDIKPWSGPRDLSGTLRFLWDDEFLYVGVEVTDDIFLNHAQDSMIWAQDSLQFLIDPFRQEARGRGRYDYAIGSGAKGPQAWCSLSADASAPTGGVPDIRISARRVDPKNGDMVYEVAIPWSRLAPFAPGVGRDLGLSMILNEDDGPGRKSFMGWFSGVHLKEKDFVGDVILGD